MYILNRGGLMDNIIKEEIIDVKEKPYAIKIQAMNGYPIHWHENITEVLMPLEDSIEVYANFEHILVKKGDFWIVNNKTIHSVKSSSKVMVAVFHIDLNYYEKYFEYIKYMFFRNNMYSEDNVIIESDNYDDDKRSSYKVRFRNLLISVLTDATSNDKIAKELTKDSIYQLVAFMVKEFDWLKFANKSNKNFSPLQLNRYHRSIKYIDENYKDKITLDDIANNEYITKNYLSHLWRNLSYFSFQERLNYERVMKSGFLLLTANMSISSISESCGFSDVKYYYLHFKRWYGCSPLEFKKRCLDFMHINLSYEDLELDNMAKIIEDYIKNIILPEYARENIWNTTELFDNYVRMKYLYKIDKITPQRPPRNVSIDILNTNNFKMIKNIPYFNWQNIDLLVNFSETSNFDFNIKIECEKINNKNFKKVVGKFLNSCIYRYSEITIAKWVFFIFYSDEMSFKRANAIGDLIESKIENAKIKYFFEV